MKDFQKLIFTENNQAEDCFGKTYWTDKRLISIFEFRPQDIFSNVFIFIHDFECTSLLFWNTCLLWRKTLAPCQRKSYSHTVTIKSSKHNSGRCSVLNRNVAALNCIKIKKYLSSSYLRLLGNINSNRTPIKHWFVSFIS